MGWTHAFCKLWVFSPKSTDLPRTRCYGGVEEASLELTHSCLTSGLAPLQKHPLLSSKSRCSLPKPDDLLVPAGTRGHVRFLICLGVWSSPSEMWGKRDNCEHLLDVPGAWGVILICCGRVRTAPQLLFKWQSSAAARPSKRNSPVCCLLQLQLSPWVIKGGV